MTGMLLLIGNLYTYDLPQDDYKCPCIIASKFIAHLDLTKRQKIINDVQHVSVMNGRNGKPNL